MKRLFDPTFRYSNSAESEKPGYLARKFDRLYPGWRNPKPISTILVENVKPMRKRA